MFRSSCNLLALSIPPGLLSMSCCYFQISTSVLWYIIIVPRVAPIAQTLWGHSTAPAKLNISGMELDVKVCFLNLWLALWECHFMEFWNHLEITVFLAVCLVFRAFIFCLFVFPYVRHFLKHVVRGRRNYGMRTRQSAKSPSSIYRIKSRTSGNFSKIFRKSALESERLFVEEKNLNLA